MAHIVVEFGGSRDQLRVVEWAIALGQRRKSRLTLLNVLGPDVDEPEADPSLARLVERREAIEAALAAAGHDGLDIVVRVGDAIDDLIRFGEEHDADLLVVGRRSIVEPDYHDGVARLLHRNTIPVVVVVDRAPIPPPDTALTCVVGIDGTEANTAAVERIAELVEMFGADAVPVQCVDPGDERTVDEGTRRVAALLGSGRDLRIIAGSPAEAMASFARDSDAAIIAVGTRGPGALHDHIGRQLGEHLLDLSDRAILIVPSRR